MAGCGAVCYEADPESTLVEERMAYVGSGQGSYMQVSNMEMVGKGRGDYEKEKVVVSQGYKLSMGVVGGAGCMIFLIIFLIIGFLNNWWQNTAAADDVLDCSLLLNTAMASEKQLCCSKGFQQFCQKHDGVKLVDKYYYHVKNVKVNHVVPVPVAPPPREVITHKVMVHTHAYDCNEGALNWQQSWSAAHSRYCCYLREIGCKTKVEYRPHYHTITRTKDVPVKVPVPIPAPPAAIITHVQNVPIHDPPAVIKVNERGPPHVVNKYVHEKQLVPVPVASPPVYHHVPVPVPVQDPGQVIKVPEPLPPQTIVKNKVLYKTRHIAVKHVYDCSAGFSNWQSGWSSDKKSWCCSNQGRGCPGSHSGHLTKTVVTGVTQHVGPTYYHHIHHSYGSYGDAAGIHHSYGSYGDADEAGDADVLPGSDDDLSSSGSFSDSWLRDDRDLKQKEKAKSSRRLQEVMDGSDFAPIDGEEGFAGDGVVGGEESMNGVGVVGGEESMNGDGVVGVEESMNGDGVVGGEESMNGDGVFGGEESMNGDGVVGGEESMNGDGVFGGEESMNSVGVVGEESMNGVGVVGGEESMNGVGVVGGEDSAANTGVIGMPAPVIGTPEPTRVHTIVRNHYGTVLRKVPVNHYVKVQMPQKPPIVHTVQVQTPAKHFDCGMSGHASTLWSDEHKRWCCYKFAGEYCPKAIVDKNIYHTVVKTRPVRVPVPEPMPAHAPIVKTIHHTYRVPSPPVYQHVHVPGPTVVKPVVVHDAVHVPVPQPPKVINVKQPYTVHVPGPNHYVHVPVPTAPHVVTKYHTQWNTVVDGDVDSSYDCDAAATQWHSVWSHAKMRWCCSHRNIGCPGTWHTVVHHVHTVHYSDDDAMDHLV